MRLSRIFLLVALVLCGSKDQAQNTVSQGMVNYHTYKTAIARNIPGNNEQYYVYTPAGYDPKSSTKYPVLYLLHGWSDHAGDWMKIAKVDTTLNELIAHGKARPMIVVMPECYGEFRFLTGGPLMLTLPIKIDENVNLFSQMLLKEIIPKVESEYKVSKKREDRAIAGFSMGGLEALTVSLENPKEFDWVGGFSSELNKFNLDTVGPISPKKIDFRLLWMSWGISDPFVNRPNRRVAGELEAKGLTVTTSVTQGNHSLRVANASLIQLTPLLFKSK